MGNPMSGMCTAVWVQPGCTGDWIEITGATQRIEVEAPERDYTAVQRFGQDTPLILIGPRKEVTVRVTILYTTGTSDAYNTVWQVFENAEECSCSLCVRWSPEGDKLGALMFTTASGSQLVSVSLPSVDIGSTEPLTVQFTVVAPSITVEAKSS